MVVSTRNRRCTSSARAVALLVLAAASVHAAVKNSELPINLEAASTDFDYKNNSLVFKRVRITQGNMQVEAQEARATGLNFDNSEWELHGEVQIFMPDGKLTSSDATVTFRNNEIQRAVIVGKPAAFEQKLRQSEQLAQGRATTIDYDVKANTVKLTGDAWLTDGQNQINGQTLIYRIGEQRVAANPEGTEPGGVRITINPRSTQQTPNRENPPRQEPAP